MNGHHSFAVLDETPAEALVLAEFFKVSVVHGVGTHAAVHGHDQCLSLFVPVLDEEGSSTGGMPRCQPGADCEVINLLI